MDGKKWILHLVKGGTLYLFGGWCYGLIEVLFRGYTHWTMALLGGGLFLLIGGMDNWMPWEIPLWLQGLLGGVLVTVAELLAGLLLNVYLGLDIWDYSSQPGNLLGQICPMFSLIWCWLSVVVVFLDDCLRCWMFGEEMPHYKII
jgi:uncharacterized membrane protein